MYYARKLLRVNENEYAVPRRLRIMQFRVLSPSSVQRRKAKERLDVLIEHNGENAEVRRKRKPGLLIAGIQFTQLNASV